MARMLFFVFKRKTAYEVRISDWSSDVCSSDLVAALGDQGYEVESQARISQQFEWYFKRSGIAPYREKTQAGLALVDRDGQPIFVSRTPERAFDNFEAVPPLLVNTLPFIENRERLDQIGRASCRARGCQYV